MGMDKLAREHVVSEERCPMEGLRRQSSGKGAPGQPGSWGAAGSLGRAGWRGTDIHSISHCRDWVQKYPLGTENRGHCQALLDQFLPNGQQGQQLGRSAGR